MGNYEINLGKLPQNKKSVVVPLCTQKRQLFSPRSLSDQYGNIVAKRSLKERPNDEISWKRYQYQNTCNILQNKCHVQARGRNMKNFYKLCKIIRLNSSRSDEEINMLDGNSTSTEIQRQGPLGKYCGKNLIERQEVGKWNPHSNLKTKYYTPNKSRKEKK